MVPDSYGDRLSGNNYKLITAIFTVSIQNTMDLIHKLSTAALILLSVIAAGMLIQHQIITKHLQGAAGNQIDLKKYYEQRIAQDTKIYSELIVLLNDKKYKAATEKLQEIKSAHPKNPLSSVYMAEIQYQQGEISAAIHSYRIAVESEPDYVDKKTPLYIGDKILNLINESRSKLNRENKLRPGDKTIRMALDDIYYLERRIAGGCE